MITHIHWHDMLKPAMSVHARITAVNAPQLSEGVGYGLHYRSTGSVRICTVPVAVHARVQQIHVHEVLGIGNGIQARPHLALGDKAIGNAWLGRP